MSTSSAFMPLSLISEHKTGQGNPSPAQQLSFSAEKLPLVQVPKRTLNGMEQSPTLVPELPPSQPEPQPNLPCGGVTETITHSLEEGKIGRVMPVAESGEILSPTVPNQFLVEPGVVAPSAANLPSDTVPVVSELAPPSVEGSSAISSAEFPLISSTSEVISISNSLISPTQSSQANLTSPKDEPHNSSSLPDEPQTTVTVSALQTISSFPELSKESNEETSGKTSPTELQTVKEPAEFNITEQFLTENGSLHSLSSPSTSVGRPSKRKASYNIPEKKCVPLASNIDENNDVKRAKRKRLPTQVYQSPIPEEVIIAKISKIDKTPVIDDKLIVFYRNEFLAVRNTEGGFYVCQAMQNVYKSSVKIRIRWLSQIQNSDLYSPDFYDTTEFDCILTNLNLERIEKNKYRLPHSESKRTLSILKRAIDVENGVVPAEDATVTEEHPDGLDLSLFRNEDQLKKRKRVYRHRVNKKKIKTTESDENKKNNRGVTKRSNIKESKKASSTFPPNQSKLFQGRIPKVDTPVVQRIVAAKKLRKRKTSTGSNKSSLSFSATKEIKKKETVRNVSAKKKISEPSTSINYEKKFKPGISKTKRLLSISGENKNHD